MADEKKQMSAAELMRMFDNMDDDLFNELADMDGSEEQESVSDQPAKKIRAPSSDKFSILRGIPTVITMIARNEFPDAKSNTDAVIAYLCCFCPEVAENPSVRTLLTPDQKSLVKEHREGAYTSMLIRLLTVGKKLDRMSRELSMTQALCMYLMYDRLGLRMHENVDPDTMKGCEMDDNGRFMEFYSMMEEICKEFHKRKSAKDGRPFGY